MQPQVIDPLLKQNIGHFLRALEDPDINVRRVALVAFNSAAHNKPSLIRDLLDSVLPKLYAETEVKVRVTGVRTCTLYAPNIICDRTQFLLLFSYAERTYSGSRNGSI